MFKTNIVFYNKQKYLTNKKDKANHHNKTQIRNKQKKAVYKLLKMLNLNNLYLKTIKNVLYKPKEM